MQSLAVSGAVRPIYGSLGVKRLSASCKQKNGDDLKTQSVRSVKNFGKFIPNGAKASPANGIRTQGNSL